MGEEEIRPLDGQAAAIGQGKDALGGEIAKKVDEAARGRSGEEKESPLAEVFEGKDITSEEADTQRAASFETVEEAFGRGGQSAFPLWGARH